jgi:hypothetical protein
MRVCHPRIATFRLRGPNPLRYVEGLNRQRDQRGEENSAYFDSWRVDYPIREVAFLSKNLGSSCRR